MSRFYLFILAFLFCGLHSAHSQGFSHEIGVIAGPVAFQSDYGERGDASTFSGNTGFAIGLVHYLNFSYNSECNCYSRQNFFNDHFKVRSELSYITAKLQHEGQWVDASKTSTTAEQLRNMRGEASIINLGMQLEYFPLSIRDFSNSVGSFAPYISAGAQFSAYSPKATSTTGPLTVLNTPVKYRNAFTNEDGTTWSAITSVGTRYKLSEYSDLLIDLRFQYYFSDWVDGLKPDPNVYKENKSNDWMVWLNFGYIYYID